MVSEQTLVFPFLPSIPPCFSPSCSPFSRHVRALPPLRFLLARPPSLPPSLPPYLVPHRHVAEQGIHKVALGVVLQQTIIQGRHAHLGREGGREGGKEAEGETEIISKTQIYPLDFLQVPSLPPTLLPSLPPSLPPSFHDSPPQRSWRPVRNYRGRDPPPPGWW